MRKLIEKNEKVLLDFSNHGEHIKRQQRALSNYVSFTDPIKVYALDNIYEHAKDVFGPFGGIYTEIFQNPQTQATVVSKSKDGHSFFNSIAFESRIIENVMAMVREKTLYVSGFEGKTSRDGTTSLALISSAVSREVLLRRMANPNEFKLPSRIIKLTLEVIEEEFRNIIEKNKNIIYDGTSASYIGDGFNYALNAINTTVDGNGLFTHAFKDLMSKCLEKGIDITSSVKVSFPEKIIGDTKFEIKLNTGIRLNAQPMTQNKIASLLDHRAPSFILDGYVGDHCHEPFMRAFKPWVKALLETKDENGFYLFSKYNPKGIKPPVFFYNRSTDRMLKLFTDLEKYVKVKLMDPVSKEVVEEVITPTFIFLESEDTSKEQYDTFLKIFKQNVISLNGLRRHILDSARHFIDKEDKSRDGVTPFEDEIHKVTLSPLFQTECVKNLFQGMKFLLPEIEFDASVTQDVKEDSVLKTEFKEVLFDKTLMNISFDGSMVFINPEDSSYDSDIKVTRDEINKGVANYNRNSIEYDNVVKLLNMFNTATFTPSFTYKTEDEFKVIFDLYQDAQGIFESVHVHGVMAGGNVSFLRYYNELQSLVKDKLETTYNEAVLEEDIKDKYMNFANHVLDSLMTGYVRVYQQLTQLDDSELFEKIERYSTDMLEYNNSNKYSWNIITNKWEEKILESTRSTVDIFSAGIELIYDMLNVNRVKINCERDSMEVNNDFSSDIKCGIVAHPLLANKIIELVDKE